MRIKIVSIIDSMRFPRVYPIVRYWNSGMSLDEASRDYESRFPGDNKFLLEVWESLGEQYGTSCVPVLDPNRKRRQAL